LADAVREQWFDSPAPLLRRLAIDDLRQAAVPAEAQVSGVLRRRMLFQGDVRHEPNPAGGSRFVVTMQTAY
jgi:hypothetical protein